MMVSAIRRTLLLGLMVLALPAFAAEWPALERVAGPEAQAAMASLSFSADLNAEAAAAFASAVVGMDGWLVQETARFAADAYYRFFCTNRPHRIVGRDALGVYGLLHLYRGTGDAIYLRRAREILAEARRSHDQPQYYWPGHQSGCGPNGVARQHDYEYIPLLLAMLHVKLLQAAPLPPEEQEACWSFVRLMAETSRDKGQGGDWAIRRTSQAYVALTALADRFPQEAQQWLSLLRRWNEQDGMPQNHDGAKVACWINSAIWFDAWAWDARWLSGTLHVRPRAVINHPGAPAAAVVPTPAGRVTLTVRDGRVTAPAHGRCRVVIED